MRSMLFLTVALSLAAVIGCDRNRADGTSRADSAVGTAGQSDRNKVTRGDKSFVHDIAIANMAEVELAKLVPERSTDDEIKKFAQLMIDDHTKALDALRNVASQHNLEVPAQVDDKHRGKQDKLAKKQGLDFDKAYCDEMVDAHQDLVDKLESRIDKANLAEYKAQVKDRVAGTTVEEKGQAIAIIPEKSDNPVTMSVNQWAADTYPIAAAHLEAARTMRDGLKNRTTH